MGGAVLHLVSDSTGDTAAAAANAVLSQFDRPGVTLSLHVFVRSFAEVDRVIEDVARAPGLVVYTILDEELRRRLEDGCARHGVRAVALLEPLFAALSELVGADRLARPGRQYETDTAYFERVAAIDYAMSTDDGAVSDRLLRADVILMGVSRTSKTPTCIYLACRGVRAANVPLLPGVEPPARLVEALEAGVPAVGLTASPTRLAQIRTHRMESIGGGVDADYAALDRIRREVADARLLLDRLGVPVIDVTRRSIEETAAAIMAQLRARKGAA